MARRAWNTCIPTTPSGGIQDLPLRSSTAESRLKGYLKDMNGDEGEMLHGFSFVLAVQLRWLSSELSFPYLWTMLAGRVEILRFITSS